MIDYPDLFTPYRIKNTVFRNRIMSAPNGTKHKTPEGFPREFEVTIFETRAKGGAAQVTTGSARVTDKYRDQPRSRALCLEDPDAQPSLTEVALAIRRHGAVSSIELNHPGPMAMPDQSGGRAPIGPISYIRDDGVEVSAMNEEMMEEAVEAFGKAAFFAKQCQFEMCMIHGGHGWLISSFLSAGKNKRTDRWGGSHENRARLAVEICKRIREKCGDDFLIEFRLTGDEFIPGGTKIEDAIIYAKLLEEYIDLIHVSAAGLTTAHHNPDEAHDPEKAAAVWGNCPTPHILQEQGCYVHLAGAIKKSGVKTPVVTVGAITTPETADEIIASGKADFVAMARALIADPELPKKAKHGQRDDITPCIRCEKCNDRHVSRQCTVNPEIGRYIRQLYMDRKPAPRKVAIIGGGPGGMQAAITASKQGHDVTLYEEKDRLGGMLNLLSKEYLKREMRAYRDYLIRKTNISANVLLMTKATKSLLEREKYDYIIAAVGGTPIIPDIPGVDKETAITAAHIHDDGIMLGRRVCVLGGGMAGCEAAFELAEEGYVVSLVEVLPTLFPERDRISRNYSMPVLARLEAHDNVTIYRNTKCTQVLDGGIKIESEDEKGLLPADSVVFAVGVRPNSGEVDELWNAAPEFRAVGDCVSPRFILDAVSEAYFAAMDIC